MKRVEQTKALLCKSKRRLRPTHYFSPAPRQPKTHRAKVLGHEGVCLLAAAEAHEGAVHLGARGLNSSTGIGSIGSRGLRVANRYIRPFQGAAHEARPRLAAGASSDKQHRFRPVQRVGGVLDAVEPAARLVEAGQRRGVAGAGHGACVCENCVWWGVSLCVTGGKHTQQALAVRSGGTARTPARGRAGTGGRLRGRGARAVPEKGGRGGRLN